MAKSKMTLNGVYCSTTDIVGCSFIPGISSKPKGVRLGYMGHLTLISEDVIGALDHFPGDLRLAVAKYIPETAWDEYVTGRYIETKKKDSSLLGGGKPIVVPGAPRATARWRVDEEDNTPPAVNLPDNASNTNGTHGMRGEFQRASGTRPIREISADFGRAAPEEEDEVDRDTSPPQVCFCFAFHSGCFLTFFHPSLHSILPRKCTQIISDHQVQMTTTTRVDGFLIQRLASAIPQYQLAILAFNVDH
jgi:hypothetical protein